MASTPKYKIHYLTPAENDNDIADLTVITKAQADSVEAALSALIVNPPEVAIQPDQPTDPTIDIWVDTDEVGGSALTQTDADARYVPLNGSKAMTGALFLPAGRGIEWPGANRMLYTDDAADALMVLNTPGGLATLRVASPTLADEAATKGYVDTQISGVGGGAQAFPAGRVVQRTVYAGIGTDSEGFVIPYGVTFAHPPHVVATVLGYADINTSRTVSLGVPGTGSVAVYPRKNNSVTGITGCAVMLLVTGVLAAGQMLPADNGVVEATPLPDADTPAVLPEQAGDPVVTEEN